MDFLYIYDENVPVSLFYNLALDTESAQQPS